MKFLFSQLNSNYVLLPFIGFFSIFFNPVSQLRQCLRNWLLPLRFAQLHSCHKRTSKILHFTSPDRHKIYFCHKGICQNNKVFTQQKSSRFACPANSKSSEINIKCQEFIFRTIQDLRLTMEHHVNTPGVLILQGFKDFHHDEDSKCGLLSNDTGRCQLSV